MMVDVESAGSSAAVNTAPVLTYSNGKVTNQWSWSPGNAGQIVIVRVMYDLAVFGRPCSASASPMATSADRRGQEIPKTSVPATGEKTFTVGLG